MKNILACFGVVATLVFSTQSYSADKLLQSTDLIYIGAFKVPHTNMGVSVCAEGFSYGGQVMAFRPSGNRGSAPNGSIYLTGCRSGFRGSAPSIDNTVAELAIPTLVNSDILANLNTAPILQNMGDPTEGSRLYLNSGGSAVQTNNAYFGGLLVYGTKLIGTSYSFYDGNKEAVRSHFKSGLDLSITSDFEGNYEVGSKPSPVPQAAFVAGYMTSIPSAWQSALGGTVLTGMGPLSIISRASSGPALFSFNPDELVPSSPAPANALVYYDIDHLTLGTAAAAGGVLMNSGTWLSGAIFPSGSKSVLVIGRNGTGASCYGGGNSTGFAGGEARTTTVGNAEVIAWINNHGGADYPCGNGLLPLAYFQSGSEHSCCYDPDSAPTGGHAYPYKTFVWAYSAEDLAEVKKGNYTVTQTDYDNDRFVDGIYPNNYTLAVNQPLKPWNVKPYATWEINFPFTRTPVDPAYSGAAAYDESTNKLYIVQTGGDTYFPIIHAYSVNVNSSPINGTCGSSNGGSFASAPTTNLCTTGTPSPVTGTYVWSCAGSNGGTNANCSASQSGGVAQVISWIRGKIRGGNIR